MGVFFSSHHLTDVIDALKNVESNIIMQRTHGDAAWLHVKRIQELLEDVKVKLYYKVCSSCKPNVSKILGATPGMKRNLTDILPPDRHMLLRDLARSMIEMERSKSGNTDVSDTDINQALAFLDQDQYAKLEDTHEKTVKEYTELFQDVKKIHENNKIAELEKDEALVSKSTIEKELNEMRNTIKHMQSEKDGQQAENEELKTVVQRRTKEGSKLASENAGLRDKIFALQTRLDAQIKALTMDLQTASNDEENRQLHVISEQKERKDKEPSCTQQEIRQLREDNEAMSAIIERQRQEVEKLQCDIGTKFEELQAVREDANTDIQDIQCLRDDKHLLEEANAKYVKEMASSAEEIRILNKQTVASLAQLQVEQEVQTSMTAQITKLQDENARYAKEIANSTKKTNKLEMASKTLEREKKDVEDALNEQLRRLQDENTSHVNEIANATKNIKKLKSQLTTSKSQIETLNEKIDQTEIKLETTSTSLEIEKQEVADVLNKQLRQLQDENSSYVEEMSNYAEKMQTLNRTITSVSQSRNELEEIARTLEREKQEVTDRLTKQVTHLQEMTENMSSSVVLLQQDNNKLRNDLSTNQEELKSSRKEIEQNRQQNQRLEKEIARYIKEIDNSTGEITTLKRNLTKSDIHKCRLEKEVAVVTNSKDHLETLLHTLQREQQDIRELLTRQMTHLPDEKENLVSIISGFQSCIDRLQLDLRTKTEGLDSALNELKEMKSKKKSLVMGLRIERSGMGKTMVDMVSKELTKRLQRILDRESIDITIKLCQTPAEVPNGPLVVLCLNMSRVGTNILDALAGIKINQDVFVLVLHNTIKENLSSLTPTSLRITGGKLRGLGGIMDMALSSDSGVYDCDLNSAAVDKMATTLKKYSR